MKPRVFVGSSSEGLPLAQAIHANLVDDAEVTVWNQGVFDLSSVTLDSLLKVLDSSEFGVFLFTPDDVAKIREQEFQAARDNVIFELGLFMGGLGKDHAFVVVPDDDAELRIPTDLLGITPAKYESNRSDGNLLAATGPTCTRIKSALSKVTSRVASIEASGVGNVSAEQSMAEASSSEIAESQAEAAMTKDDSLSWLILYVDGKFKEALQELSQAIQAASDPDLLRLRCWSGRVQYKIDPDAGTKELEALIGSLPEEAEPYIHLAYSHLYSGLYDQCLEVTGRGIRQAKVKEGLYVIQAKCLLSRGDEDGAFSLLRQAVSDMPSSALLWTELVDQLDKANEPEAARVSLEQAVKALPFNETLLAKYAQFLYAHGEKEQALLVYDTLVERYVGNEAYLTLRGNIYLDLELFDLAMEDYKRANDLAEEKQEWIIANIGNLLKNRGFYTDGIAYLKRALELDANSKFAHERLAIAMDLREQEQARLQEITRQARLALASKANDKEPKTIGEGA